MRARLRLLKDFDPEKRELAIKTKSPDDLYGLIVVGIVGGQVKKFTRGSPGAGSVMLAEFDDSGQPEDPKVFKTLSGAEKHREAWVKHCNYCDRWEFEVAFWAHPEATHPALERYVQMTGSEFPDSSPRE